MKIRRLLILLLLLLWVSPTWALDSLTQYGITWTFSHDISTENVANEYQYGTFTNGDYWVVANAGDAGDPDVVITSITPASTIEDTRTINGAMINPMSSWGNEHGFDSAVNGLTYAAARNFARPEGDALSTENPLELEPSSSLISCISIDDVNSSNLKLQTAAVLTILSTAPGAGSFRPPYCGVDKTVSHNISSVTYDDLGGLAITGTIEDLFPNSVYDEESTLEYLETAEDYFERPWIDHVPGWGGQYLHPQDNMEAYGNDLSGQVSNGSAIMHLDFTDEQLAKIVTGLIQVGIDLYGAVASGGTWPPDGGHASGRKWPILFAGIMLDDADMKAIGEKSGDYLDTGEYEPGDPPPDYIPFGEDAQTFYVTQFDVDLDHSGDRIEYEAGDIGLAEWGIRHATVPIYDDKDWGSSYRGMHNIHAWGGMVLAALIMEAEDSAKTLWNHDALFDYLDRDADVRGLSANHFVTTVWGVYRDDYPIEEEGGSEGTYLRCKRSGGKQIKSGGKQR